MDSQCMKEQINVSPVTRKEIAEQLGISYFTLSNKLNGYAPFTLEEERSVRAIIKEAKASNQ